MAEAMTFNIGADTKGFQDGIGGLLGVLGGLVAAFVSAQAVIEAFGEAIDLGGRLNDLSTRTGETAGNLAILERAFENTSVGADKLGPAISKMQQSIVDLSTNSPKAAAAFKELGLTLEEIQGKAPTEQLRLIGERLDTIPDPAMRASTAVDIFGKSGADLLPVLLNFDKEIAEAKSQLGSLPELLDKSAGAVDELGDNLHAIRGKLTEMAYGFLSEVIPAVNAFVEKLSSLDAAGIGATLADALVGAFVQPMKAAELLGDVLLVGVKVAGNELIYGIQLATDGLFKAFQILGTQTIPMLGQIMLGSLEIAAGSFGVALYEVIAGFIEALRPIAQQLGFEEVLDNYATTVGIIVATYKGEIADGTERIAGSADRFSEAWKQAMASSTAVRQDYTGATAATEKMKSDFAAMAASGKEAVEGFGADSSDMAEGRTTTGTDVDPLTQILIDENKARATQESAVNKNTTAVQTLTQAISKMNQNLGAIAGIDPNQAIGQSASAQRAQSLQQRLKEMELQGKEGTQQYSDTLKAYQNSLRGAFGVDLDAADRDAATQWARENLNKPGYEDKTFTELEGMAQENILDRKAQNAGVKDILDDLKNKQQESENKTGPEADKAKEQKQTPQSIASALLALMQRIEPRIPVANLA
jgi:hypothetical protein